MDAYQEQKDIYRAVIAAVGVGDLAALELLLAQDLIDHNPMPDQASGIVGFQQWASAVRSSFPDFHGSVEVVLAESNLVAGHVLWRGTQRGWFLGVPPSDRQVEISAFHIVRFSRGRIAEWWGTADLLGALQQLGAQVVPPPR
ncbi:MAG TPA: ester cyclase [Actinoplanes sp.]|nr:ester cyclase [Actinoplanes sp.]